MGTQFGDNHLTRTRNHLTLTLRSTVLLVYSNHLPYPLTLIFWYFMLTTRAITPPVVVMSWNWEVWSLILDLCSPISSAFLFVFFVLDYFPSFPILHLHENRFHVYILQSSREISVALVSKTLITPISSNRKRSFQRNNVNIKSVLKSDLWSHLLQII